MNKQLGIYFGKEKITLIELKGKEITRQASIPISGLGDKSETIEAQVTSTQARQLDAIREAFREYKFEAKNIYIGLSSKDLFIRGFQMLPLTKSEMDAGVRFEAKKYLPFKTEDLAFDYQQRTDKKLGKMDVLFMAAPQTTLDNYLGLFEQLGRRTKVVESASIALLRILADTKQLDPKLSFALVVVQDLDIEFSIVIEGFLCFSRDIALSEPIVTSDAAGAGVAEPNLLERIVNEVRVSLDYFRRQFSGRAVDKIIFIGKGIKDDLAFELGRGLGLEVEIADLHSNKELNTLSDLDALKAYAVALKNTVKVNISLDLSTKKYVPPVFEEEKAAGRLLAVNFKIIKPFFLLGIALLAAAYLVPLGELTKDSKNLEKFKAEASDSLGANFSSLAVGSLTQKRAEYNQKLGYIKTLLSSRWYLTTICNIIPKTLKQGLWLDRLDISINTKVRSLRMRGAVYLGDQNREAMAVNDFLLDLKSNPDFMRGFNSLEVTSISQAKSGDNNFTVFEISGS